MEKINNELNLVYAGKIHPEDSCEEVQIFLRLGAYNVAQKIANLKTREQRHKALENVKQRTPFFYDGVKHMALEIFKNEN